MDPVEQFVARATEVGATVHVTDGDGEAIARVVRVFESSGVSRVVLSPDLKDLETPLRDALSTAGATLVEDPAPEAVAMADLGVSRVELAVAETGSILVAGNDLLPRLSTMLPLIHVALVDRHSLVASLDQAGEYLRGRVASESAAPLRYASFVTGPSRTADIEKTLSTGMHGPRELHIVLMGG